jgi:glycine/sarcosine N-methyltransferase
MAESDATGHSSRDRSDAADPFSRANYRSLIAWPARIRREAPFLESVLADLPDRSIADLGCGTGEHARYFAALGIRARGLDLSPSMIEDARREGESESIAFVQGDVRDADALLGGGFGAAICLGNTLPFLETDADLDAAFGAAARLLLPGGRFLFQILNYERLRARGERALPVNVQASDDGEIVFLRLLGWPDETRVLFFPTTLRLRADSEEPVEVVRTRRVVLRAWTRTDVVPLLARAGFAQIELFGAMERRAFEPLASSDLVVLARKPLATAP